MRAVIQRVAGARVITGGREIGVIGRGLCVLLGAARTDGADDVDYMVEKTVGLRVFEDAAGKMNLSVREVGGAILAVSQFTLLGDARKGRRPSFIEALEPALAERLYDDFVAGVARAGVPVATGSFGAKMSVELTNDGPVTILLDSRKDF